MGIVKLARVLRPESGNVWGVYGPGDSYYETDHVQLINARFVIDPVRQERDRKLGTKGLHAWIEGHIARSDYPFPLPGDGWLRVCYTLDVGHFHYENWAYTPIRTNLSVDAFHYVVCNAKGRVWVYE